MNVPRILYRSFVGIIRFGCGHPVLALQLLFQRVCYFFSRRILFPVRDHLGFIIDKPCEMISYWSFFVMRELDDPGWRGEIERSEHPLVVDIGANAGVFCHYIYSINRGARFVAVEPVPVWKPQIEKWSALTGCEVVFHGAAVSDREGEAKLYLPDEHGLTASLKEDWEGGSGSSIDVRSVTLDSLVDENVCLLKIDVEGAEKEVLRGAHEVLGRTSCILVEIHDDDSVQEICSILGSAWARRRLSEIDYFFYRKSR